MKNKEEISLQLRTLCFRLTDILIKDYTELFKRKTISEVEQELHRIADEIKNQD